MITTRLIANRLPSKRTAGGKKIEIDGGVNPSDELTTCSTAARLTGSLPSWFGKGGWSRAGQAAPEFVGGYGIASPGPSSGRSATYGTRPRRTARTSITSDPSSTSSRTATSIFAE